MRACANCHTGAANCRTETNRSTAKPTVSRQPTEPPKPTEAPKPTVAPTAAAPTATVAVAKPPAGGRLALVKSRGKLVCGVNDALPGFSALDKATGQFAGFDADFCRALAVAVLGDATKVEFRPLNTAQRGPALADRRNRCFDSQHDVDLKPRCNMGLVRTHDVLRWSRHDDREKSWRQDTQGLERRDDLCAIGHDNRVELDGSDARGRRRFQAGRVRGH